MRVLYLHAHPQGEGADPALASYPVLPVGAVGLMNRLASSGHEVLGLNLPVERMVDPTFTLDGWLDQQRPSELVLVELHWYEHAVGALDAADRVRRAWPGVRIVAGGLTASRYAEELLALCPAVDGVIRGPAEAAVEALALGRWAGTPGLVYRGGPPRREPAQSEQIDALDTAGLGWLRHAEAYPGLLHSRPARARGGGLRGHWVMTGRGCAFDCGTCGGGRGSFKALWGMKGVLRRDPRVVAAEVLRLRRAGVQQLSTSLDPDMLGPRWRRAFFGALAASGRRPGLYVESFQLPSPALLEAMEARSDPDHSELAITPLSGDPAVRWANGKRYRDDALIEALDAAAAAGLSIFLFFSLNLPGEDEAAMERSVALAERLLQRLPEDGLRIMNIAHTLDPASPVARDPETFGVEQVSLRRLEDYLAYGRQPRPWTFEEGERGFVVPGRDLRAMVQRWDTLAARWPGRVMPVPRV